MTRLTRNAAHQLPSLTEPVNRKGHNSEGCHFRKTTSREQPTSQPVAMFNCRKSLFDVNNNKTNWEICNANNWNVNATSQSQFVTQSESISWCQSMLLSVKLSKITMYLSREHDSVITVSHRNLICFFLQKLKKLEMLRKFSVISLFPHMYQCFS